MLTLGNISVEAAVARIVALGCDIVVTVSTVGTPCSYCLWDRLLAKIKMDALFFANVNITKKLFILE